MISLLPAQDVPLFCEFPVGPGKPLELRFPQKRKVETHFKEWSKGLEGAYQSLFQPPYPVAFLEKRHKEKFPYQRTYLPQPYLGIPVFRELSLLQIWDMSPVISNLILLVTT